MQRQLGLDRPVFGHVFESEIHASGAALNPGNFAGLAIEGEFAVRICRDIPDSGWIERHPMEVISSAFPVIELHNYVFRGE
jgi:2-keto-4-pentenoate hydratase